VAVVADDYRLPALVALAAHGGERAVEQQLDPVVGRDPNRDQGLALECPLVVCGAADRPQPLSPPLLVLVRSRDERLRVPEPPLERGELGARALDGLACALDRALESVEARLDLVEHAREVTARRGEAFAQSVRGPRHAVNLAGVPCRSCPSKVTGRGSSAPLP